MKKTEEVYNEDGYVIATSDKVYQIGDIMPSLIQLDLNERTLKYPFRITGKATRDEYKAQLIRHGAKSERILYREYFYKCITD